MAVNIPIGALLGLPTRAGALGAAAEEGEGVGLGCPEAHLFLQINYLVTTTNSQAKDDVIFYLGHCYGRAAEARASEGTRQALFTREALWMVAANLALAL